MTNILKTLLGELLKGFLRSGKIGLIAFFTSGILALIFFRSTNRTADEIATVLAIPTLLIVVSGWLVWPSIKLLKLTPRHMLLPAITGILGILNMITVMILGLSALTYNALKMHWAAEKLWPWLIPISLGSLAFLLISRYTRQR